MWGKEKTQNWPDKRKLSKKIGSSLTFRQKVCQHEVLPIGSFTMGCLRNGCVDIEMVNKNKIVNKNKMCAVPPLWLDSERQPEGKRGSCWINTREPSVCRHWKPSLCSSVRINTWNVCPFCTRSTATFDSIKCNRY